MISGGSTLYNGFVYYHVTLESESLLLLLHFRVCLLPGRSGMVVRSSLSEAETTSGGDNRQAGLALPVGASEEEELVIGGGLVEGVGITLEDDLKGSM